jgi:pantoate--beta-alanine ligase
MRTIRSIADMHAEALGLRAAGRRIGFVPTMGALHEGHLSLLRLIEDRCDTRVLSVFVNPTQFAPHEDFAAYPRDLSRDTELAASAGCDILFAPEAADMYPAGFATSIRVAGVSRVLEGAVRPEHFDGVTTVVCKLLLIVAPHAAVFGRKDAQQAVILRRMAADLNLDVEMIVAPIVREPDGLAMSSRNAYLSPADRVRARALSAALRSAKAQYRGGERDAEALRRHVEELLAADPAIRVDYVAAVNADTLETEQRIDPAARTLLALAARIGGTRLIDNTIVQQDADP